MTTTLVLGGPRSGKSRHAEQLLAAHPKVTFIATRLLPDRGEDPDLADRIARHQGRRPDSWRTVETRDLTRALVGSRNPVLLDSVGDWLTGVLDEEQLWADEHAARQRIDHLVDELALALRALPFEIVVVTQDTWWLPQPTTARDRLLTDLLGHVNRRLSGVSQHVHAVIAGRVLDLSGAPVVGA